MDMLLEPEQEALLIKLVQAARNVPREARQKFHGYEVVGGAGIIHEGLPSGRSDVYMGDLELLARAGFVYLSHLPGNSIAFDVTPEGYQHYERLQTKIAEPSARIEHTVRQYLDSREFSNAYSAAYAKWASAEKLLWQDTTQEHITTVGHLCREALQEFADALLVRLQIDPGSYTKDKTVARLRLVLAALRAKVGETEASLLDALLQYWGTVSDVAQRQEHGAIRERGKLRWDDTQRVVFHTAVVMFEIARVAGRP